MSQVGVLRILRLEVIISVSEMSVTVYFKIFQLVKLEKKELNITGIY